MRQAQSRGSSRVASAFALGLATLQRGERQHCVLNSLSEDFVSVSLALQAEGGDFEESGKRLVWSRERATRSAPGSRLHIIAVDVDMAERPWWMQGLLRLLHSRAAHDGIRPLPYVSFELVHGIQRAMRLLQRGNNVG